MNTLYIWHFLLFPDTQLHKYFVTHSKYILSFNFIQYLYKQNFRDRKLFSWIYSICISYWKCFEIFSDLLRVFPSDFFLYFIQFFLTNHESWSFPLLLSLILLLFFFVKLNLLCHMNKLWKLDDIFTQNDKTKKNNRTWH